MSEYSPAPITHRIVKRSRERYQQLVSNTLQECPMAKQQEEREWLLERRFKKLACQRPLNQPPNDITGNKLPGPHKKFVSETATTPPRVDVTDEWSSCWQNWTAEKSKISNHSHREESPNWSHKGRIYSHLNVNRCYYHSHWEIKQQTKHSQPEKDAIWSSVFH